MYLQSLLEIFGGFSVSIVYRITAIFRVYEIVELVLNSLVFITTH